MNTAIHLNFHFQKNCYHATVRMLRQGSEFLFLVRFFDKTIQSILTQKGLVFHWSNGLQSPLLQELDERGRELIASVKDAVLESFIRPTPVETVVGNYRGL